MKNLQIKKPDYLSGNTCYAARRQLRTDNKYKIKEQK